MKRKDKWLQVSLPAGTSQGDTASSSSSSSSSFMSTSIFRQNTTCKCRKYHLVLILLLLILTPFLIFHEVYHPFAFLPLSTTDSVSLRGVDHQVQHCAWSEDSPWLFNIDTKLNVLYTSSQWFHVTETILGKYQVQHESQFVPDDILRQDRHDEKVETSNKPREIYFHFYQDHFEEDLVPFTSMMIYWGSLLTLPFQMVHDHLHFASSTPTTKLLHYISDIDVIKRLKKDNVGKGVLVPASDLQQQKSLMLRGDQLTDSPQDVVSAVDVNFVCMRYMGSIEGTPQKRRLWFHSEQDLLTFRQLIRSTLQVRGANTMVTSVQKKKKYKLVLYQRNINRYLLDVEEVMIMFKQLLPNAEDWEMVIYEHSNHVSPTVWAHRLHDVDVFLSTHGFQMALLYFLPRPSIVLEVFPHHYYKVVYERLAIGIGLAHDYWISEPITLFQSLLYGLISPKACINFLPCRMFARNTNVRLSKEGVVQFVQFIQQHMEELQSTPQYAVVPNNTLPHKRRKYLTSNRDFVYQSSP